jgi:hypothetical protein
MAEAQSLVDQGVDRVQDALKSADKEFQKIQRRVKTRRRSIERRIEAQRKSFEKNAQKQMKNAQKQIDAIRKNDLVKRVEALGNDVQEQLESGIETVLGVLQIASKADIERVDRKLNRISKKLKELEASPQA